MSIHHYLIQARRNLDEAAKLVRLGESLTPTQVIQLSEMVTTMHALRDDYIWHTVKHLGRSRKDVAHAHGLTPGKVGQIVRAVEKTRETHGRIDS